MKNARQTAILSLIQKKEIETQEELATELKNMGILVTQATVSRDIKELRLLKVLSAHGGYKYATQQSGNHGLSERFARMFIDSVLSIQQSKNIIVIKTLSGSANVAAEAIDNMNIPQIIGTMAGDNTVLVVVDENTDPKDIVAQFKDLLH